MFCTHCGNEVQENAIACLKCGVPPRLENKFCSHCGQPILNPNQVMCVQCGRMIVRWQPPHRNKFIAAVLAFFLGGLGAHKFYNGSWGWGFVYLAATISSFILVVIGSRMPPHIHTVERRETVNSSDSSFRMHMDGPVKIDINQPPPDTDSSISETIVIDESPFLLFFFAQIVVYLIAVIEAIRYLAMDANAYDRKYNQTPAAPFKW